MKALMEYTPEDFSKWMRSGTIAGLNLPLLTGEYCGSITGV
jgi:hypothetical protein